MNVKDTEKANELFDKYCSGKVFSDQEMENLTILCFKIMEKSDKIRTDKFMLGCALKYILHVQKGGIGRGDENEGIIARYKINNPKGQKRIEFYINNIGRENLIIFEKNGFVEIRRKRSLLTPMGCFFTDEKNLRNEIPKNKGEVKEITIKGNLNGKIFTDFAKDFTCEVNLDDLMIINYYTPHNIVDCLKRELNKIGIKELEVIPGKIIYDNIKDHEWECPFYVKYGFSPFIPYELFFKDMEFAYQNETRIVINSEQFLMKSQIVVDHSKNEFIGCMFDKLSYLIDIEEQTVMNIINSNSKIKSTDTISYNIKMPLMMQTE